MRWAIGFTGLLGFAALASIPVIAAEAVDEPAIIEVIDHPAGVLARAEIDEGGNLVIYGTGGYKQIIVDGGNVLDRAGVDVKDLFRETGGNSDSPSIFYYRGSESEPGDAIDVVRRPKHADPVIVIGECVYRTAVVRGRSYMYGVDRNQTPIIAGCE